MATKKSMAELRRKIDGLDRRILGLLSKRAVIAKQLGAAKSGKARSILDVARERAVVKAVLAANPGPLSNDAVEAVFREVISACRDSQRPVRVAYMGPEGTFSHEAAIKQFGRTAGHEAVATIAEVFSAVEAGRCSYGVVPVENTSEGAVTPTLDCLLGSGVRILAEVVVKVDHCLMSRDADVARIRRIASHPQPLAQCRRYLGERFPGLELRETASTTAAAKLAARTPTTAAIASRLAAKIYGLKLVARSVQDQAGNVTRFLVLGMDKQGRPSGDDRSSLVVSVRDEVGVLERVLKPFARNGVNMSMIESRPLAGRSWEYNFFMDISGHVEEKNVAFALAEVAKEAIAVKVLGSYPVAG